MTFKDVYVVDGARTPFLKVQGKAGPFSAADLAVQAGRDLLLRQPFAPTDFDEVIIGCASPSPDEVNIGRVIALRLGCGDKVHAWTVMRNCASGMQALDSALTNIQLGRANLVLAGGTDALSHAPLLFSEEMTAWFAQLMSAKTLSQRLGVFAKFRPNYLKPVIGLLKGLTDPIVGLGMGQTAENLVYDFKLTAEQQNEYAVRSHLRAVKAREAGAFKDEISPLIDKSGKFYPEDDGIRPDSSVERLSRLRPVFDKQGGTITAGNSSQVTDGASLLILASAEAVARYNLEPIGKITDSQWAGLDPSVMGLGPVHAATPILERHQLGLNDVDLWEINEAFAAQVLGCLAAWDSEEYCQEHFGRSALGCLDEERLNVDGGAIAIGHPVGASGARIVLHLLHALKARGLQRGIATICIGGGQGGAMLVETMPSKRHEEVEA